MLIGKYYFLIQERIPVLLVRAIVRLKKQNSRFRFADRLSDQMENLVSGSSSSQCNGTAQSSQPQTQGSHSHTSASIAVSGQDAHDGLDTCL
tara:strand:- start:4014 stop:4289 length:276 start_codon:yes stop_codon:yes gene_type:complete